MENKISISHQDFFSKQKSWEVFNGLVGQDFWFVSNDARQKEPAKVRLEKLGDDSFKLMFYRKDGKTIDQRKGNHFRWMFKKQSYWTITLYTALQAANSAFNQKMQSEIDFLNRTIEDANDKIEKLRKKIIV